MKPMTTYGSSGERAGPHRAPQVIAGSHQLHELALPLVLHLNPGRLARLPRDVGAGGELVGPGTVLPHEDDPGTTPADVLNDRLGTPVPGGERLDAVDQARGRVDGFGRQRRIGTICHGTRVSRHPSRRVGTRGHL